MRVETLKLVAADTGTVAAPIAWLAMHQSDIQFVIQCGLGLAGIVAAICAARYHWKAAEKIKS